MTKKVEVVVLYSWKGKGLDQPIIIYCYIHSNKYNKVFIEHMVEFGFAVTFFGDQYIIKWY